MDTNPTDTALIEDWGLYETPVPIKGRAVFAGTTIPANKLVLKFQGPVFTRDTCPDFSEAIQVGINSWMWSSGGLDDLVNHSCNPNTGLYPLPGGLYLFSLREIAKGEELSFDYSTSMVDEPWSMACACGEDGCRGKVANFLDLPAATQRRYADLGVLPEHVRLAYLTKGAGSRADLDTDPAICADGSAEEPADDDLGIFGAKPQSNTVTNWELHIRTAEEKGRGVFTGKDIPVNKLVLKFDGPIYSRETCPNFHESLQVGLNAWMWSSGGVDDLVNHSCNPNCGLYTLRGEHFLIALRDIDEGDEITFDYSTSMVDEPTEFDCACGEATCRGRVLNFPDLPDDVQRKYADMGVLPEHVLFAYETRGAGKDLPPKTSDTPANVPASQPALTVVHPAI